MTRPAVLRPPTIHGSILDEVRYRERSGVPATQIGRETKLRQMMQRRRLAEPSKSRFQIRLLRFSHRSNRRETSMRVLSLLLAIYVGFAGPCVAVESGSSPETGAWGPRGVFAFGNLVFDFQKKVEVFGPITNTLADCSTTEFFCAYAGYLHIVLPRHCSKFDVGGEWIANGVKTAILFRYMEQHDLGVHSYAPSAILVLGDGRFPGTVYEYEVGNGLRGIYLAKADENLVVLATQGRMAAIRSSSQHFELETLDPFGRCSD